MLKYIELKTGHGDSGPAWIARVKMSRSGASLYFADKCLHRLGGGGVAGNYFDVETREEYWVSGVKKDGSDRHWAGSGKIQIETSAVSEYLELIGATELNRTNLIVIPDLVEPDAAKFHALANEPLER
jgi:hypothetical protein